MDSLHTCTKITNTSTPKTSFQNGHCSAALLHFNLQCVRREENKASARWQVVKYRGGQLEKGDVNNAEWQTAGLNDQLKFTWFIRSACCFHFLLLIQLAKHQLPFSITFCIYHHLHGHNSTCCATWAASGNIKVRFIPSTEKTEFR